MAHRRSVDRVRSVQAQRNRDELAAVRDYGRPYDDVFKAVEENIERARVVQCLSTLTDLQREAVVSAYYGGRTYREVAQDSGAATTMLILLAPVLVLGLYLAAGLGLTMTSCADGGRECDYPQLAAAARIAGIGTPIAGVATWVAGGVLLSRSRRTFPVALTDFVVVVAIVVGAMLLGNAALAG